MSQISIIVAMSENMVIGLNNQLPWHFSVDLKRFKSITMNKPIVMGRNTWHSLGRPLPGRTNIVISRNPDFSEPGCLAYTSLQNAIEAHRDSSEIMIIGGSEIYRHALPVANRMYMTLIHKTYEGDTYFPEYNVIEWQVENEESIPATETTPAISFIDLVNNSSASGAVQAQEQDT